MQAAITDNNQQQTDEVLLVEAEESVCKTPQENYRLAKLFEILIDIDKSLKKSNEDN